MRPDRRAAHISRYTSTNYGGAPGSAARSPLIYWTTRREQWGDPTTALLPSTRTGCRVGDLDADVRLQKRGRRLAQATVDLADRPAAVLLEGYVLISLFVRTSTVFLLLKLLVQDVYVEFNVNLSRVP